MNKPIIMITGAIVTALALPIAAQEAANLEKDAASTMLTINQDTEAAANTIALINHINYVVEVIRSYNNPLALEEEYQKLADNLNLNRIPDEEVLGLIRDILDVLYSMRMNERDREWLHRTTTRSMNGARVERMGKVASDIANGSIRFSWRGIAQYAIDTHYEHEKTMRKLRNDFQDKQFDLDTQKLEQLHKLADMLLERQWSLIQRYRLDDRLRISQREVQNLVKYLKDTDHRRCFKLLKSMSRQFEVYPTYWHYRAAMALSCDEYEDVLASCEHFNRINRGLFRHDPMAANIAMFEATALLQMERAGDAEGKAAIRNCLEEICQCNYDFGNSEQGIFCVAVYLSALEDTEAALEVLDPLEARLAAENESELVDYCDLTKKPEDRLPQAPITTDMAQCRMLRLEIEKKDGNEIDINRLKDLCEQETTCSLEKLFYFGQMRIEDLWEIAKRDIVAINFGVLDGNLVIQLPIAWFLLGDIDIEAEMRHGDDVVCIKHSNNGNHELVRERSKLVDTSEKVTYSSFTIEISEEEIKKCDNATLKIRHPSWPVEIAYVFPMPQTKKDQTFVPIKVISFMDKSFDKELLPDHPSLKYGEKFKEWMEDAEKGNVLAQVLVGLSYYEGEIVEQDYAEAVKWFDKAAKEGDADAQYYLGQCYLNGWGVEENDEEAILWYKKAADHNNNEAQYKLGLAYEFGWGVKQNDKEALEWYRKAAAQNDEDEVSNAQYRVNALEADLKRRSVICKTFQNSDLKFGFRLFTLDTEELYLATSTDATHEKRDKAVKKINDQCEGNVFEKDVLFWNEPYEPKHSTVIITSEAVFYLQKKEVKRWRFEDINELDWERKSDGCIMINGTPCKIVVYQRKPFVDAMKKILYKIRQENKQ